MGKNIVICCDGTGNEYGTNNTNVVVTYEFAKGIDGQLAFYDPGVGTGGWEYQEGTGKIRAVNEMATGKGVQINVNDAYRFLMDYYEPGDKLYLFGFSRGAFTARSLAGMLYKVGLLGPEHENLVEYATKLYNTNPAEDDMNEEVSAGFKKTFSITCPVHFIGVWDTVDSTILGEGRRFTNGLLNPEVSHGYHAMSIDERRKDFPVFQWEHPNTESAARSVQQVWFPGVHSDVGGWYEQRGLANGALRWMMSKAVKHGLKIDMTKLADGKYKPDALDQIHNSRSGFWRLRSSRTRKIASGTLFHRSVEQRLSGNVGYNPKNLPSDFEYVDDDPLD